MRETATARQILKIVVVVTSCSGIYRPLYRPLLLVSHCVRNHVPRQMTQKEPRQCNCSFPSARTTCNGQRMQDTGVQGHASTTANGCFQLPMVLSVHADMCRKTLHKRAAQIFLRLRKKDFSTVGDFVHKFINVTL